MRFPFDANKAAQAVAYLASLNSRGEISLFRIMKLLYLADRAALIEIGRPITGDQPVNMDKGGVPSSTYSALRQETEEEVLQEPWSRYLERTRDCFTFKALTIPPATDDLSEYELGLLKTVHQRFAYMSYPELLDYMHSLAEWANPQGSSTKVDPAEILRAANKSQEEIEEIGQMAEEAYFIARLSLMIPA